MFKPTKLYTSNTVNLKPFIKDTLQELLAKISNSTYKKEAISSLMNEKTRT
jgi:hypothetical protein